MLSSLLSVFIKGILSVFYCISEVALCVGNFILGTKEQKLPSSHDLEKPIGAMAEFECDKREIPSVYVNGTTQRVLTNIYSTSNLTSYTIHNKSFFLDDRISEKYVEFELYATRLNGDETCFVNNYNNDKYCSTPVETDDEEAPTELLPLEITIQKRAYGMIINSEEYSIYLTNNQWHTITIEDMSIMHCFACNAYSNATMTSVHMQCEDHLSKLEQYKPLAKFKLGIIRKIRSQYHCGVCNEIFNLDHPHVDSHLHEHNLRSAIKKVSDIDLHKNENNDIGNKNNDFNENAYFDEKIEELIDYYNSNENEVSSLLNKNSGISYADALKNKKAVELPNYLENDLGDRKLKVKSDSWHMIICTKNNIFYCMVCKVYMKSRAEHCNEKTHLENINKCKVVDAYKDYFIRQVDDRFYHCGLCNNLQYIPSLEGHIETKHLKPKINDSESAMLPNNDKTNLNDTEVTAQTKDINDKLDSDKLKNQNRTENNASAINIINDNKNIYNENKNTVNDNVVSKAFDIKNNSNPQVPVDSYVIALNIFGHKITLPLISYNAICKGYNNYYCGLCNTVLLENMVLTHICTPTHNACLETFPFINTFNYHMIRNVPNALHCALCNSIFNIGLIYIHIQEPFHLSFLNRAFGMNIFPTPVYIPPNINNYNVAGLPTAPAIKIIEDSKPIENINNDKTDIIPKEIGTNEMMGNEDMMSKEKGPVQTKKTENKKQIKDIMTERSNSKQNKNMITRKENNSEQIKNNKDLVTTKEFCPKKPENKYNDTSETDIMTKNLETETTDDSSDLSIEFDSYMYVKLKNIYFRITLESYNTLVLVGDGSKYCFVCSMVIFAMDFYKHVKTPSHIKKRDKCQFLDKSNSLLRQLHLSYHCGVCNVFVPRKDLKLHDTWTIHIQKMNSANVPKKYRRVDLINGVSQITLNVQKERLYLNDKEPETIIKFKVRLGVQPVKKVMKIIIVDGTELRICWENWNGITGSKNKLKCIVCCKNVDALQHVFDVEHEENMKKEIKVEYLPDLLREITPLILHCIICNLELANREEMVTQHVEGKRHRKEVKNIHAHTASLEGYDECDKNVLYLEKK